MNRASIALCGALAFGTPLLTSGCTASVGFRASTTPTRLVAVGPGVWTVYDYDEPVFYASGSYWWWNGNVWYRSNYVDHGWVYVHSNSVPVVVQRIDRPSVYVHYRAGGNVRSVPPGHVRHRDDGRRGNAADRGLMSRSDRGRGNSADRGLMSRPDRGRGNSADRGLMSRPDRGRPSGGPNGRGGSSRRGGDGGRGHGRGR